MLTPIRSILVSLAVLALALATPSGPSARAAPDASCSESGTHWVTNYGDSGDPGTLRWAIDQANTHLGPDRICFAWAPAKQIIRLQSALPTITDSRAHPERAMFRRT